MPAGTLQLSGHIFCGAAAGIDAQLPRM